MVTIAQEIAPTELAVEAPITMDAHYERTAPPTIYVLLPGYGQFVEDSPTYVAAEGFLRVYNDEKLIDDQVLGVELCDKDEISGKPIVPSIKVMQERIITGISDAQKMLTEGGQVVLVCHSLACLLVAGLSRDQLRGINRIIFVSPVYDDTISQKLINDYDAISETIQDSHGRFFITPEFIDSLKSIDIVYLLRQFILMNAGIISAIVATDDGLAHNEKFAHFVRQCHKSLMGIDFQAVVADHFYSGEDMRKELAVAIARVV